MATSGSCVETPSSPPTTDAEAILINNGGNDDDIDNIYDDVAGAIIDYRKGEHEEDDIVETYDAMSAGLRANEASVIVAKGNCDHIHQTGGDTESRNNHDASDESADEQEVKAIYPDDLAKRDEHDRDVYNINGTDDCTGLGGPAIKEPTSLNADDGLGSSNVDTSGAREQFVMS
ncbi:hypothetical protein DL770_000925 [Monosporascus sp. CRB-9-2]|nr:hypothetical protein DL770_000925 [Monosporascus sp. CRB-9-2]